MKNFKVGVLGATGAVGQNFIRLLQNHPWFSVKAAGASKRSAGKKYKEAAHWIEAADIPEAIAEMTVRACNPKDFKDVDFVFSGLDSSAAGEIERKFAEAGIPVISNAKNYRMDEHVPLLIPEVNPAHASLIKSQTFTDDGSGWIVTNPNCVCVTLATSLAPIYEAFGIEAVAVTSLQSISGAGYPGVSSMDMIGNVVPFIGGEEDKIVEEPLKMLGKLNNQHVKPADFKVQAAAMRVPTIAGHLLSVSVQPQAKLDDIEEAVRVFETRKNPVEKLNLPSSPDKLFKLYKNPHHPQPRLHAERENGMQIGIG